MVIDPIWEQVHSSRNWFSVPNEQLVIWLCNKYQHLPPDEKKRIKILDIGCGQGPSTIVMAHHGFHIVALDGSISALSKLASNLAVNNMTGVDIVHADMASLPFGDGYFDAVVDVASICMNDNCQEIFDEVVRVLKPDGRFFSVMAATNSDKDCWDKTGPITFFDPDKIRKCLGDNFKLNLWYKCLEAEDKSQRLSHWIVMAQKREFIIPMDDSLAQLY